MSAIAISVTPDTLEFRRPFSQVVRQFITLTNTATDGSVLAFKIKTTAPKQYCVRPNAGTIMPGGAREIEVLLQAMREDPPLDFRCKDKFLVQSTRVPSDFGEVEDETARATELWTRAEEAKRFGSEDAIYEKKIKVAFLAPLANNVPQIPLPNTTATSTTTAAATASNGTSPVSIATVDSAAAVITSAKQTDRELRDAKDAIKRLTIACEGYKAEIERLNVLRQRKAADEKSGNVIIGSQLSTRQTQQTLPLPLAIALALIAFILGAVLF
ncbi:phosphatidylinositol-binding protein scs2 [Physocladia obscura]|uniref:Phosphatidylinositol-binding protein scs2 n=1 Tax=Physocladia obscura TaxID=109957 RepID=A0AAD5XBC7_9FUNG|nr:phosphatidylinositol-binding protein scs2 [Physocladia obscura]